MSENIYFSYNIDVSIYRYPDGNYGKTKIFICRLIPTPKIEANKKLNLNILYNI